jgi:hypothetical protein
VFSFYYLYARYDTNKATDGAVSDVVHGLSSDVYFKNAVRLHGRRVNIFLFMPAKKIKPSLHRFLRHLQMFNSIMSKFLALNFTQVGKKRRKCGKNCFYVPKRNVDFTVLIFVELPTRKQCILNIL